MKEVKEQEIKLFGRKLVLPDGGESNSGSGGGDCDRCLDITVGEGEGEKVDDEKQLHTQEEDEEAEDFETKMQENVQNPGAAEESQDYTMSSELLNENPKTPSIDEDVMSENDPKSENEQSDEANRQQKTLKKPDKILPCPRCNSMDTKFCYYNNYNINQPRHFCKSCQRYWTAGGTMRNVPVGAGRRKNKNSASHCRHITISEALQADKIDAPEEYHHPVFKPSGAVLSFGTDSPLCESMASVLNLADQRTPNEVRNGYHNIDNGGSAICKKGENKEDSSIGLSVTAPRSVPKGDENGPQKPVVPNINGFPYAIPCIPGVAWPIPWNSALPLPAIYPPGYPMSFYPAPYWNCGLPNAWNVPWVSTPSPTSNQKATGSGPNSPLGKHSRNGELLKPNSSEGQEKSEPNNSESSIVVPKTLRIDDPEEAAKSSIWETLGIKYDSSSREGLFKALQPKGDEKKVMASASPMLQANPAALSRSISFQEGA